jgi:hypothetical protein
MASAGNCPLWHCGHKYQGRKTSTLPTAVRTRLEQSGTHFAVMGFLPTRARNHPIVETRRIASQQLAQRGRTRLMHGRPHRHLHRLKIQTARPTKVLKDDPEQFAYFAFDFVSDRLRRFFSRGDNESSTGRTVFRLSWKWRERSSVKITERNA